MRKVGRRDKEGMRDGRKGGGRVEEKIRKG